MINEDEPGYPQLVATPNGSKVIGWYSPLLKLVTVSKSTENPQQTIREELNHLRKQALSIHERSFTVNFHQTLEFYNNLVDKPDPSLEDIKYMYVPNNEVGIRNFTPLIRAATHEIITDSRVSMELIDTVERNEFDILQEKTSDQQSKEQLVEQCKRLFDLFRKDHSMGRIKAAFENLVAASFQAYPEEIYNYIDFPWRGYVPTGEITLKTRPIPAESEIRRTLNSTETAVGKRYPLKVPDGRLEYLIRMSLELYQADNGIIDPVFLTEYARTEATLDRQLYSNDNFIINEIVNDAAPALSASEREEWKWLLAMLSSTQGKTDPWESGIGFHYVDSDRNELRLHATKKSLAPRADVDSWPDEIDKQTLSKRYAEFVYLYHLRSQLESHICEMIPLHYRTEEAEKKSRKRADQKYYVESLWDTGDWILYSDGETALSSDSEPYNRYNDITQKHIDTITKSVMDSFVEMKKAGCGFIQTETLTDDTLELKKHNDINVIKADTPPDEAACLSAYINKFDNMEYTYEEYVEAVVGERLQEPDNRELMPIVEGINDIANEIEIENLDRHLQDALKEIPDKQSINISNFAIYDICVCMSDRPIEVLKSVLQISSETSPKNINPIDSDRFSKILYHHRPSDAIFWIESLPPKAEFPESIVSVNIEAVLELERWGRFQNLIDNKNFLQTIVSLLYEHDIRTKRFPETPIQEIIESSNLPSTIRGIPGIGEKTEHRLNELGINSCTELVLALPDSRWTSALGVVLGQLPSNHEDSVISYSNSVWEQIHQ